MGLLPGSLMSASETRGFLGAWAGACLLLLGPLPPQRSAGCSGNRRETVSVSL